MNTQPGQHQPGPAIEDRTARDDLYLAAAEWHDGRDEANYALDAFAAEVRAAALEEAADHLDRQADELWAPGRTANSVMHADADELRRMAAARTERHPRACPGKPPQSH